MRSYCASSGRLAWFSPRTYLRRRWGACLFGFSLAMVVVAGCGTPPAPDILFAEYVLVAQGGISTDTLLPPHPSQQVTLLGEGWAPSTEDDAGEGRWVYGHDAEFRFYHVAEGDLTLEFRAAPFSPPRAPEQVASVSLNGQVLRPVHLVPGWQDYEISLPARHLRIGWNAVRMEFRYALRPSAAGADRRDRRPLSARFSRLRVRSSLDRPLWPDRPDEIALAGSGESPGDAVVEMPTDSVMEILTEAKDAQRLVGSVGVSFVDPNSSDEIRAIIDLVDAEGNEHRLFEYSFTSDARSSTELDADLSAWRSQLVMIRTRCWGGANGMVRWARFGLTAPGEAEPAMAASEQPASGRMLGARSDGLGDRPDIIFIMLDAARADAFLDADHPPATPNIDILAEGSTHFRTAWAPSSWTGQTVPAVFTGHYPDAVGAEVWGSRLPEEVPTLPELLSADGYFTVVWSQHNIYRGNPTLRRGFEDWQEVRSNILEDRLLLPDATDLFVDDRPTFAMIHLLPPHAPYEPPEPFRGRLSSWYTGDFDPAPENLNRMARSALPESEKEELARYSRARYHENVEFADHLVGRLVRTIRDAGRYDDALIVIFSDHGEAFFEHGRFLHTALLYEEFLRVPLFLKWPAQMDGFVHQVSEPVSLVDLAPTLLDGLQVSDPPSSLHGRSLIPLAFDDATYHRELYAYTHGRASPIQPARPVWALRSGRHKVMYSGSEDILALFDMEADPGELDDLAVDDPLRAKYLAQRAMMIRRDNLAFLAQWKPQGVEALDEELLRQLRALGYVH